MCTYCGHQTCILLILVNELPAGWDDRSSCGQSQTVGQFLLSGPGLAPLSQVQTKKRGSVKHKRRISESNCGLYSCSQTTRVPSLFQDIRPFTITHTFSYFFVNCHERGTLWQVRRDKLHECLAIKSHLSRINPRQPHGLRTYECEIHFSFHSCDRHPLKLQKVLGWKTKKNIVAETQIPRRSKCHFKRIQVPLFSPPKNVSKSRTACLEFTNRICNWVSVESSFTQLGDNTFLSTFSRT